MKPLRLDTRWQEAVLLTAALWFFVFLVYLPVLSARHQGEAWTSVLLDAATFLMSALLALPLFALMRRVERSRPWVAVGATVLGVVTAALAQVVFDMWWTGFVAENLEPSWMHQSTSLSRSYSVGFNYAWIFSVNVALFYAAGAKRRAVAQERVIADARSAAQQAQFAALRFQLNPHFLFNTLNAISAMIVTHRNDRAEEMTERLASFLRASLASDPMALVPLEEELEVIGDYLDIESVRFGDRLVVDIDCPPNTAGVLVPSFLLQPLVENAIKYGVAPSREPVTVRVEARLEDGDLVLGVIDNGAAGARGQEPAGTGIGLTNISRRIEALYGARGSLSVRPTVTGFSACIRLPAETVGMSKAAASLK